MTAQAPGWQAALRLHFQAQQARTCLVRREHHGPLLVQRPFYPEGPKICHSYIIHPPGGVVAGDHLLIEATIAPHAHALLTTAAAGKFYRSEGAWAQQQQTLRLQSKACLEWLPMENIAFDRSKIKMLTRVALQKDSQFIGWEILCLGRPAAGEGYGEKGSCRQSFELWRDDVPLWWERGHYGDSPVGQAPWGLRGHPVSATMICTTQINGLAQKVREATQTLLGDQDEFAVSQLPEFLLCRYLGEQAERARMLFIRAWAAVRPALFAREACPPRIWAC